jgi:2-haloacid dehalogenase
MTHSVKALIFDVFGTVVDWRSGVAREVSGLLSQLGREDLDPYAVADAWRGRYQPAMEEIRAGRRPFVTLDVLHLENLQAVLPRFGLQAADIPAGRLQAVALGAWRRLDPWPDAAGGLARLRRAHVVAPLSNGNLALLVDMARHGGLEWDAILGGDVVQAYKPSPQAYRRAVELLGLEPGEVCMVAAHNLDLAAARACGLRTAFVPRPTEHGPGQARDLEPSEPWDWTADDFEALAAAFGL